MLTKSESIAELVKALVAAQAEFKPVNKNHENPFYKSHYADLGDIIEATSPALRKHGLAVVQLPGMNGTGMPNVTTMLTHTSGEWVAGELSLPAGKPDAQGYGSAFTYGRRYGLQAILGVAAEEDDDGNAASQPIKKSRQAASAASTTKGPEPRPEPTSSQAGDLQDANIAEVHMAHYKDAAERTKKGKPGEFMWVVDGQKSWPCFKPELEDTLRGLVGEDVRLQLKASAVIAVWAKSAPVADPTHITDADAPY